MKAATLETQHYHVVLNGETDRSGWRRKARGLLAAGIPPGRVIWSVTGREATDNLDIFAATEFANDAAKSDAVRIAKDLLGLIDTALLHSDPGRHALVYDIVWRAQAEPRLHRNPADVAVARLNGLAKSVRRDIHKMHAFVRFRKIGETEGRERFVAWFEPDHHITRAVAPFFRNRFAGMDWLIVTAEASIAWDGTRIIHGPGGSRGDVPGKDSVEEEWRAYYANIFNPARLKLNAMKSEMPVKYWHNLPEARLISPLARDAAKRTQNMVASVQQMSSAGPKTGEVELRFKTLDALYDAMEKNSALPRNSFSSNIVRGEGPYAGLMIVGEQPGDIEDRDGRPFVGPAGQLLDRALGEVGIDRDRAYLTNAVKRFKFVQRGKRRIHQTPTAGEISHYRWWLDQERQLIRPRAILALGGSAVRALTGKAMTISRVRGSPLGYAGNSQLLVTVHPSFLLRLPDEAGRRIEYQKFIRDLDQARELLKVA